jgi:type I restriction enzyme, S subunit
MNEWIAKTIGEICDLGGGKVQTGPFGSQLHQSDYQAEGYPFVMPKDIINGKIDESSVARVSINHVERLSKHKFSLGDIVYGRRGDIGRQALVRAENIGWLCGSGCLRISLGNANLDPKFLHFYLKLPEVMSWVENQAIGATMPNLNTTILRNVPIYYPKNIHHQQKIVAVISAYDDLIENNKRRIALLEKMAEEIYREWFVRMRFPGHEQVVFHKGIPEGWEYIELGCLLEIKHGYAFKGEFFSQDPTSDVLLTPGNFAIGGGYKDDKLKYYNGPIPEDYILNAGDMIVTMTDLSKAGDTLGYPAFVPPSDEYQFLHNQRLGKVLIQDRKKLGSHFLYNVFCSEMYRYHVVGSATGSTVKHTAPERIKSFKILLPDQVLGQKFEGQIEVIRNQIIVLNMQNNVLQKTRDRLLPRLISGKLPVEDLDIQFPPSMTSPP